MVNASLEEWRRWQRSRMPWARRARDRLRRHRPQELAFVYSGDHPRLLAAFDSLGPSEVAAVLDPLTKVALRQPVAALLPKHLVGSLAPPLRATVLPWDENSVSDGRLSRLEAAITIGEHLPCGELAHSVGRRLRIPCYVVQHGLITPFSPPVPEDGVFLAWTDEDGEFARHGSSEHGAVVTVGAQLLWKAALGSAPLRPEASTAPLFLGQLHGAELDRSVTVRTVNRLAGEGPLVYRPHPAEQDVLSRIQHRRWARRGVAFDRDRCPLPEVDRPVLGIFSTGLLEAAAAGRPTWGTCVQPPDWVEEVWERYAIARHGDSRPTAPPTRPAVGARGSDCGTRAGQTVNSARRRPPPRRSST